jgi:hypothetical protein
MGVGVKAKTVTSLLPLLSVLAAVIVLINCKDDQFHGV